MSSSMASEPPFGRSVPPSVASDYDRDTVMVMPVPADPPGPGDPADDDCTPSRPGVALDAAGDAGVHAPGDAADEADGDDADPPDRGGPRYVVKGQLGQGGEGEVLAVVDVQLQRQLALKRPLPGKDLEAFRQEARRLARLEHPHIVPLYDADLDSDDPFFVMPQAGPGEARAQTLRRRIEQSPRLEQRLGLLPALLAATRAVAYAHGQGLCHGDLKPHNVLLGDHGEVWVADWGLAAAGAAASAASAAGDGFRGTPWYAAPEQADGQAASSPPADVHALGATLYHLLAGQKPHHGLPPDRVLEELRARRAPAPLGRLVPAAPRDLVRLVERVLDPRPEKRGSAQMLADDLESFLQGRLLSGVHHSLAERALHLAGRHRAAVVVGCVLLAALIALGATSLSRIVAERRRTFAALDLARAQALRELHSVESARLLLEAGRLAPGIADAEVLRWQARRLRHTLGPFQLPVTGLAYSPDGEWLAIPVDARTVRLFSRHTGWRESVALTTGMAVARLAFSPDGRWLAMASFGGSLQLFESTGKAAWQRRHQLQEPVERPERAAVLAWDPASRFLLAGRRDGQVVRLRLPGGQADGEWKAPELADLAVGPESNVAVIGGARQGWFIPLDTPGEPAVRFATGDAEIMAVTFRKHMDQRTPLLAIAIGFADGTLFIFDRERDHRVVIPVSHRPIVRLAASERLIAVGTLDGTVELLAPRWTKAAAPLQVGEDIWELALHPSRPELAVASASRVVRIYDLQVSAASPDRPVTRVLGLAAGGGRTAAVLRPSTETTARVCLLGTGAKATSCVEECGKVPGESAALALSADGTLLAVGDERSLRVQRLGPSGACAGPPLWQRTLEAAPGTLTIDAGGTRLAIGRPGGGVQLAEATTGRDLGPLPEAPAADLDVRRTAFAAGPAARGEVAFGLGDGRVALVTADGRRTRQEFLGEPTGAAVADLGFSPDGQLLAVLLQTGTLRIFRRRPDPNEPPELLLERVQAVPHGAALAWTSSTQLLLGGLEGLVSLPRPDAATAWREVAAHLAAAATR
jgi:WD40 repeat protein